jgi:hypothetical protein
MKRCFPPPRAFKGVWSTLGGDFPTFGHASDANAADQGGGIPTKAGDDSFGDPFAICEADADEVWRPSPRPTPCESDVPVGRRRREKPKHTERREEAGEDSPVDPGQRHRSSLGGDGAHVS